MSKQLFISFILLCLCVTAYAQNFKATQKEQEKLIQNAYKHKKVTEVEYAKLMREQEQIKYVIEKYMADGVMTPHEKNVIHDKQERAAKRLVRYKTNGEIY